MVDKMLDESFLSFFVLLLHDSMDHPCLLNAKEPPRVYLGALNLFILRREQEVYTEHA